MKSSKKVTKTGGPKKNLSAGPLKKQNQESDPKESNRPILDDDDDFDIPLDDDIQTFDDFDDEDEDDF